MAPAPVVRLSRRSIGTAAVAIAAMLADPLPVAAAARPDTTFAATIARLSEPGGFFWSDNLVSNETSYLHVLGALDRLGRRGGAYLGVGPEQNFSYIARLRPSVAIIIDIRRDNLLLHLLFKAIFEQADTRLEYLCGLYGRPCPADPGPWRRRPLERLIGYVDSVTTDSAFSARAQDRLLARVARFGVPISADEMTTLARLHREFIVNGLSLTFSAYGRRPIAGFPTVRDLYLGRDLGDQPASFLATDEAYRVVRDLERADRVIPVVGDLGGPYALKAIGDWLRGRQERLSYFYLSNVEFYLLRQQTFAQFVANVAALPHDRTSLLARSYFSVQTGVPHPQQVAGHLSVQLLQTVAAFLDRTRDPAAVSYWSLMTEGTIPLAP
jgi:hypothetical protein